MSDGEFSQGGGPWFRPGVGIEQLREEVSAWPVRRDQLQATVNWQFTAQDTRLKLKRL